MSTQEAVSKPVRIIDHAVDIRHTVLTFGTHGQFVTDLYRFEYLVTGDEVVGIKREP